MNSSIFGNIAGHELEATAISLRNLKKSDLMH